MDSGIRLLIVSYHFPPEAAARAFQMGKLVKYLAREGVCGDIISGPVAGAADPFLKEGDLGGFTVHRLVQKRGLRDQLSSLLLGRPMRQWSLHARKKAFELIGQRGAQAYACLMTGSHPADGHSVGLAVRKALPALPWLAHFSDPIAYSPFSRPHTAFAGASLRAYERRVVDRADHLVFVGVGLRDFFMQPYPGRQDKARVLPHVFDPELYPGQTAEADRVTLSYLGGFSAVRSFGPLVDLVRRLQRNEAPLDRLRIRLVGKRMKEAADALNAVHPNLAEDAGEVSYTRSLSLMEQSTVLLLLDAPLESSPFFPSKLADYMGSRRPVIGITPAGSGSAQVLQELGMPVFDHEHLADCAGLLADVLKGQTMLPGMDPRKLAAYSAPQVAREFCLFLRELSGAGPAPVGRGREGEHE